MSLKTPLLGIEAGGRFYLFKKAKMLWMQKNNNFHFFAFLKSFSVLLVIQYKPPGKVNIEFSTYLNIRLNI